MRLLADDDDEVTPTASSASSSQQPAWMRSLYDRCNEWLQQLPEVSLETESRAIGSQLVSRNSTFYLKQTTIRIRCIDCSPEKATLVDVSLGRSGAISLTL